MNDTDTLVQQFGPDFAPMPVNDAAMQAFLGTAKVGPLETFKFYKDTVEIRFDRQNHIYYLVNLEIGNLTPINNVSTVCHIIDRSVALVPWGAKKVVEKLLTMVPTYINAQGTLMVREMSFEDFTKIAMEAKTAPRDELEEAGDIGSMAHSWLEAYVKALIAKDTAAQRGLLTQMCRDERATSCCLAALAWMKAHNVRWVEAEQKIYSLEFGYAGTFDGIALVDSCQDPYCCAHAFKDRMSIVDWKSSNHLHIEYLFQGAAYRHAKREEFGLNITDIWVNRLGKEDGKFEPWHQETDDSDEDFSGFIACLRLYDLVQVVEDRMNKRKRTVREAKKQAKALAKELAEATEKVQKAVARATKKLEKEEAKNAEKAAKEKEKAEKKAAKEALKAALTKAKKTKVTVANNPQAVIGRVAELSPAVAELLKDAHEPIRSNAEPVPEPPQSVQSVLPEPVRDQQHGSVCVHPVQDNSAPVPTGPEPAAADSVPVLTLSPKDAKIVLEALANPPAPNAALRALMEEDSPLLASLRDQLGTGTQSAREESAKLPMAGSTPAPCSIFQIPMEE